MPVNAKIHLTKTVDDLDKADDWFAEVKEVLQGNTDCTMRATSTNCEEKVEITK